MEADRSWSLVHPMGILTNKKVGIQYPDFTKIIIRVRPYYHYNYSDPDILSLQLSRFVYAMKTKIEIQIYYHYKYADPDISSVQLLRSGHTILIIIKIRTYYPYNY